MSIRIITKRIFTLLLCLVCFLVASFSVSAHTVEEEPYVSYSFWDGYSSKKAVADKALYEVDSVIDGYTLGIDNLSDVQDIHVAKDGLIYALDSTKGRIIVLNGDYTLNRIIDKFLFNGKTTQLNLPQGLFVENSGNIYIADTENSRLLYCDKNGNVISDIGCPESDIIPDDLDFYPIKVMQDEKGFTYLLTRGSYYGAMVFDVDRSFIGFYGSNLVKTSLVTALAHSFKRMFTTNAKMQNSIQKLPYQFSDLCVDNSDFIYTVSPNTDAQTGQIRKLSPGGSNILRRNWNFTSQNTDDYNFGEPNSYRMPTNKDLLQNFTGICVDEYQNVYALDAAYGKIYVYDNTGKSVTVFGGGVGAGEQKGVFKKPIAIAISNEDVLVSDTVKNSITIFKRTDYGEILMGANTMTLSGEYVESEKLWQEVYSISKNSQLTYRGLTKANMAKGDYEAALEYARIGLDQENYSIVFEHQMSEMIENNLWWMFIVAAVLVGLIVFWVVFSRKRGIVLVKNKEVRLAANVLLHPMDSFYQVKYKGRGSLIISVVIIALLFVLNVSGNIWGGFMYVIPDAESTNSIFILIKTVGLPILWVFVGWLVSSLAQGKGTLKEIFIMTSYCLTPRIIYNAVFLVASHFLIPGNISYLDIFSVICWIATILLMICGMIQIHEYELKQVIKTSIITLLGVAFIIFIIFIIYTLLQNFIGFIVNVYSEIALR